jgi:DNA repair exonuclease SbcCD ATPase subunit
MANTITNSDDVIDSRDVIERIQELEAEREALAETLEETRSAHEEAEAAKADVDSGDADADHDLAGKLDDLATRLEEARHELEEWDDQNGEELKGLKKLNDEGESLDDWEYGVALYRESYFVEAMQEMVQDIGDLPKNIPAYLEIDWEATAKNLRVDYTEIEFDGVTYLGR